MEILTVQYRNNTTNGLRGIYIEDGMVTMVTRYHKGSAASSKPKTVFRYLSEEVGRLVVYFI